MPAIHFKKPYRSKSHKDRNNPEIKKKKQSILVDVESKGGKRVVQTSAGDVLFDGSVAVLPDDTRADDIYHELKTKEKHPQQYALVRHREGVNTSRTHRYFFGQWPEMPWRKSKEDGE